MSGSIGLVSGPFCASRGKSTWQPEFWLLNTVCRFSLTHLLWVQHLSLMFSYTWDPLVWRNRTTVSPQNKSQPSANVWGGSPPVLANPPVFHPRPHSSFPQYLAPLLAAIFCRSQWELTCSSAYTWYSAFLALITFSVASSFSRYLLLFTHWWLLSCLFLFFVLTFYHFNLFLAEINKWF